MPGNTELELDQLWFTWSTAGLGAMPMGFRVRAASESLYDTQGMRYRRVSRFLNYELPEGAPVSEFNSRIAPISFSFVHNGDERLLIRKVFTGLDIVGRNGAFFTHLIAGLPPQFTAWDAIRLWYCPELWVESEQGLSPNETLLEKIPYSRILHFVQDSQTNFNYGQVSEKLHNLLALILSRGLPPHISMRGHSTLIAALIYGLTHTLPMQLLPNLTFTTYESDTQESEVLIAGTINGDELHDLTQLQVRPEQTTGPVSEDIQRYVTIAVNSLVSNNTEKLYNLIVEIDRREYASRDDLIELFKRRFRFGELTLKQLEDIILHPADNVEDLLDPAFQLEAAQLLLSNPDYWEPRGKEVFQKAQKQTHDALSRCLNGMAEYAFSTIQTELSQGSVSRQSTSLLFVLAPPYTHSGLYLKMLTEFAQEPFYKHIISSDSLWNFRLWLLTCASLMEPLADPEQISPWLVIAAWDKLERLLKLDLPATWGNAAIFELLNLKREIPKTAIPVVKTYEAKFIAFMRGYLVHGSQFGNQNFIDAALRLFRAIIWFDEQATRNNEQMLSYPKRADLLLALLNSVPNDPLVIETLFALVQFKSPYQLTIKEFDSIVAGCLPEVMAARSASPSLMTYLQEFILTLTPKKLMYPNTIPLLGQFQQSAASAAPSDSVTRLVNSWLAIHKFMMSSVFSADLLLQDIKPALENLVPQLQQRGQDIGQTFIEEMTPHLATLVETETEDEPGTVEYQLGTVLYVFEKARVASSWTLLNALVTSVRTTWTEEKDLSLLITYLHYGIREHAHAKLSKEDLDAYLQKLFGRVSENALNEIEKAKVLPESIRAELKSWRTKPSFIDKIPFMGNKNNKKPPTELQQPQTPPANPNSTYGTSQVEQRGQSAPTLAPPVASPAAPQPQVPNPAQVAAQQIAQYQQVSNPERVIVPERAVQPQERKLVLPVSGVSPGTQRAGDPRAMPPAGQQEQLKLPPPPEKGLQISVTIGGRLYPIHINNYEQVRNIWLQALQYWPRVLNEKLNKGRSKEITSELRTIMLLDGELKRLPAATISDLLVEYLVQDMLIQFEVARICNTSDQPFLNSANYIAGRLEEFKNFVGVNYYYDLCKNVTEQAIKDALQKLICRYHLIQYMDSQKWDWNKWLEKEKKTANFKYHKVQGWA